MTVTADPSAPILTRQAKIKNNLGEVDEGVTQSRDTLAHCAYSFFVKSMLWELIFHMLGIYQ